jgi:hypothetical protein
MDNDNQRQNGKELLALLARRIGAIGVHDRDEQLAN